MQGHNGNLDQANMGYKVFLPNCKVVFLAKESVRWFYIMAIPTEQIVDLVHCTYWQAFCVTGLCLGEDLTPVEADEHQQICNIMKVYWGICTLLYAWFLHSLLKCNLKESGQLAGIVFPCSG